jgi:hypothetical protein
MIKIYGFILSLFIACLIITIFAQTCKGDPDRFEPILTVRQMDSAEDHLRWVKIYKLQLDSIEKSLRAKQKRKKK